jgi:hypothetical protein
MSRLGCVTMLCLGALAIGVPRSECRAEDVRYQSSSPAAAAISALAVGGGDFYVSNVFENSPPPNRSLPMAAHFDTHGGALLLMASGTAAVRRDAPNHLDIEVRVDGKVVGHLRGFQGEGNADHVTLVAATIFVPAQKDAGPRTVSLTNGNIQTTAVDENDMFSVTVLEFPRSKQP